LSFSAWVEDLGWLLFQGVVIGLDLKQLVEYGNINQYFIGSGEYFDGVRAANDLREAALYLSATAFFFTAALLIISAVVAACCSTLGILTFTLVGCCYDVIQRNCNRVAANLVQGEVANALPNFLAAGWF